MTPGDVIVNLGYLALFAWLIWVIFRYSQPAPGVTARELRKLVDELKTIRDDLANTGRE
ncbi:hypothetical protein [Micromonospora carbonacea]|uniref:hypothetical protein n=1 Tax=Micromonospora carbonacea TaxID=47853 RepID=UPI003723563A